MKHGQENAPKAVKTDNSTFGQHPLQESGFDAGAGAASMPGGTLQLQAKNTKTQRGSGDYDIYIFQAEDQNLYQIFKRLGGSEKLGISWEGLQKLNQHLDFSNLKPGDQIRFPKGSLTENKPSPQGKEDYDSYTFIKGDKNPFQVFKKFGGSENLGISWEGFQKLNEHLDFTSVNPGDQIRFPKGTFTESNEVSQGDHENTSGNREVAGDPDGEKVLMVAWTIDDGPRGTKTKKMMAEGLGGIKAATWYIQYSNMANGWDKKVARLKEVQEQGGEIAIHSFLPNHDHHTWFPIRGSHPAYSTPYADASQDRIIADLTSFKGKLNEAGIRAKFVRLPGGLVSELVFYLKSLGVKNDRFKLARKIIAGEPLHGNPAAEKVAQDYNTLKAGLSSLDLALWGGSSNWLDLDTDPGKISSQSWTAESSGVGARNDNATKRIHPTRQGKNKPKDAIFERIVNGKWEAGVSKGMVILAHDTTDGTGRNKQLNDVEAVKADRLEMEHVAKQNGIRIEYHTMSSLFNAVTGENIDTYDVNY